MSKEMHLEFRVYSVDVPLGIFTAQGRDVEPCGFYAYSITMEFKELKPEDLEWLYPGALFDVKMEDSKWDISFRKDVPKDELAQRVVRYISLHQHFSFDDEWGQEVHVARLLLENSSH